MLQASLKEKRSAAKTAMLCSMGALAVTGFMRGRGARTLHLWAAAALIGFSIWHHNLYR
ncbi:hypothetical protein [Desulfobacca acetoxidans]|jgi:hypothetical protein|uniref:Uncharacterized protein n=1 Tax=Desulfobacca acetoxidans (strain ATCC 700848 / DSM 11109 / ASRB2) TaxID=880072 RepID=F2NC49_DESAR|nr:hypothetical protein [Desulfobacca acetoxidans]AEB08844.1 hypothetical protein Desac_0977 [Desulfobacca acetoxidans DSM 11109]